MFDSKVISAFKNDDEIVVVLENGQLFSANFDNLALLEKEQKPWKELVKLDETTVIFRGDYTVAI